MECTLKNQIKETHLKSKKEMEKQRHIDLYEKLNKEEVVKDNLKTEEDIEKLAENEKSQSKTCTKQIQ